MALSVMECAGYARRRLGGEPSVPILSLCNWAGDYLVNVHPWGWLEQPPASLNLVAGQRHIALPANFGRALGKPRANNGSLVALEWATMDEVASLRSAESVSQWCFYGAIAWRADDRGLLRPRIELSAEIQTTQTAAFLLSYSAAWSEPESDSSVLSMPTWIEPLYLEILFAYAQGHDDHDQAQLSARLAEIEIGPLYAAARRRDGSAQPSIGMMTGGAVQRLLTSGYLSDNMTSRALPPS